MDKMDNINFLLVEPEINKKVDLNVFLGYDEIYDIDQLKYHYNVNYTTKGLSQILQYYGLPKNKMVKEEMIQVLLFYETDPDNKVVVERRMRLWQNVQELKMDPYFSKYILF
jgi:hypothetical protein